MKTKTAVNVCMHRYFSNHPGQPQRMKVCQRASGHQGECGPKEQTFSYPDPHYMSSVECGELGIPYRPYEARA